MLAAASGTPQRRADVKRDRLKRRWVELEPKVRETWKNLTDSDLEIVGGQRDRLRGKIQERYGVTRDEAQRQVDEFCARYCD